MAPPTNQTVTAKQGVQPIQQASTTPSSTTTSNPHETAPLWYADVKPGDVATWASALISLIAMGVAIWAARKSLRESRKANEISDDIRLTSKQAMLIAAGQSETNLRAHIAQALRDVTEITKELEAFATSKPRSRFTDADKLHLRHLKERLRTAVDFEYTAYDFACRQYYEQKIQPDAFRSDFAVEIKRLCEEQKEPYRDIAMQPANSKFKYLWRAYEELHNPAPPTLA